MPNPVLIYIAYRADTGEGIADNIEAACHRARLLHRRFGDKVYPVVPHLMGGWAETGLSPTDPMREYHMAGLIEVMRACGAVWLPGELVVGYSEGVRLEFLDALGRDIFCFASLDELEAALPSLQILANKELMAGIEEGRESMRRGGESLTYGEVWSLKGFWPAKTLKKEEA